VPPFTIQRIGVFEKPEMPGTLYFQKTKLLQFESKTPRSELGRSSSAYYHALGGIFARMMKYAG
jgi:hypothetical protein